MDLFRLDLVLFLYTFLNVFLDNTIAIRLERGPSNVTANVGDTILLICDVIDNSENTVLWYNKNKHMFISEEDRVYNFDQLPRNYDVLHNRDASSYTLRITDATTENAGWYECGFRNSLNHYESFEAAAYVMVSDPRQPPSPMLSPPVCRVTELPRVRVGEFEVDVDCSWVSPGTGDNVRAALFFNDVQLEPNVTLHNRVISRIPSPQSQQNRIVCGVGLENTAIIVNSTCQIVSNQIARVRIDPLVNNVYKGNVADFNCSIDGHGNNRIDITFVKDERNLSTERSSDTLNIQFVPVLQENNTVLECVASDLPGNTVRTVSFLRVLSAPTTTEKVTTTAAISTTSTPAVTQTPLPITREHLSLIFIILIIMAIVIALFCIFALVGVFARRHRRKLWISEKPELESVPPVDLVESRIILTELCDEASEDNSANDVPAYAASKLPDPDADSHLPSNSLPIVTYRRSSLPENVLKSTGGDDLSMFRSRKQSEPFVVYARPNNFQKMAADTVLECNRAYESLEEIAPYAKPNKSKIRKWASQGAAVFQERSATVHGEGSEPFPVYAKPNKSSISLNRAETLKPFPHYAKPEIKERKYLSQRVCKSSAPLNKTRKFMSLSKERLDPAMSSSIGGYSEVRAADGHHGHGDKDEMPQYAESTRRVLAREARSKSIPNAASAIRVLPPSPRYADPINVCTSPGFHQSESSLNAESTEISQERRRIPPSAGMADSQDSLYESMPDGLGSIDGLRPASTLMRHDDDDCSKLSDYQIISESNMLPTKQLEAGIDNASHTECNELIQNRFGHCTEHAPDTRAEVNTGDDEMTENPLYEMSRLKQIL